MKGKEGGMIDKKRKLCVLRKCRDVLGVVDKGAGEDQVERETFQIKRCWSKTTKTDIDEKRRKRVKE